jgi:hypothetical protein
MIADAEPLGDDGDTGDEISTLTLSTMLFNRAKRLQEWTSMKPRAPARFAHEEMRLIYEAFEALSERFGMMKGENCTQCEEGYYSWDNCTYCGHEYGKTGNEYDPEI